MTSNHVTITWKDGLHLRAATTLVMLAREFRSAIWIGCGHKIVNATNILQIVMLGAAFGTPLVVTAQGIDEARAVQEITAFFSEAEEPLAVSHA